jgi:hypothetical protein
MVMRGICGMKILVIILFFYSLISGCGSLVTVPIDQKLLSQDKATMIVYHDQGFSDDFRVFIDHQFIGQVTSEKPLKITVEPGQHDLYVELPMAIDRVTTQTFKKGKAYYMKIWIDMGLWVSSVRIDPSNKIDTYTVRSFK